MLIFIQGNESFLAHQIIRQLKDKYLAKNPDGVELMDADASEQPINWADLRAAPLFAQNRLIFIRQVSALITSEQESLANYLSNLPESSVVVIWDGKPLKKGQLLDRLSATSVKKINTAPLTGLALAKHIDARSKHHQIALTGEQKNRLQGDFGNDLWGMETELAVMSLGSEQSQSKVRASEPFAFYRAVQTGNWLQAKKLLLKDHAAGVPIELLIGSIASAIRKSNQPANYRELVNTLADLDLGLKTGLIDESSAIALMRTDLPKSRQKRVVWEEQWEENLGG
ncbi:MAG: hypothetical protein WD157_01250 [Patescibacteria group bacterium]